MVPTGRYKDADMANFSKAYTEARYQMLQMSWYLQRLHRLHGTEPGKDIRRLGALQDDLELFAREALQRLADAELAS